ncbi:MAG: MarR family transcriptional regulator, partial [Cyanobacteria bacterium J06636_16]
VGCNFWAWAFLDKVCQASAYLEKTLALPELTGKDLQTWLVKLIDTPLETAIPECSELQVEAHDDDDWQALADAAEGFRTTAVHLWLRSLRLQATDLTEAGALAADIDKIRLIPAKPERPELMTLEVIDRYLLHSLLIHSEMTRSHLALSLGESERTIRPRVQVLQREGVILQRGRRLSIHPAHYPKLCSEMQNNNFLTGKS